MTRKYGFLAARIRILEKRLFDQHPHSDCASGDERAHYAAAQLNSHALHVFHNELTHFPHHYPTSAACAARPEIGPRLYAHARKVHRQAAVLRHPASLARPRWRPKSYVTDVANNNDSNTAMGCPFTREGIRLKTPGATKLSRNSAQRRGPVEDMAELADFYSAPKLTLHREGSFGASSTFEFDPDAPVFYPSTLLPSGAPDLNFTTTEKLHMSGIWHALPMNFMQKLFDTFPQGEILRDYSKLDIGAEVCTALWEKLCCWPVEDFLQGPRLAPRPPSLVLDSCNALGPKATDRYLRLPDAGRKAVDASIDVVIDRMIKISRTTCAAHKLAPDERGRVLLSLQELLSQIVSDAKAAIMESARSFGLQDHAHDCAEVLELKMRCIASSTVGAVYPPSDLDPVDAF